MSAEDLCPRCLEDPATDLCPECERDVEREREWGVRVPYPINQLKMYFRFYDQVIASQADAGGAE